MISVTLETSYMVFIFPVDNVRVGPDRTLVV